MKWTALITVLCWSSVNGAFDDPKCIIDNSLAASATDNYVDCSVEVMVAMDKTECCEIDGVKGCCKPGGRWKQFEIIGIGIGVTTGVLMVIFLYCFWLRKTKNRHLLRCMAAVRGRYYRLEERCGCCKERVYRRKQDEQMRQAAKEVPAFSLPVDSDTQDEKPDDFWEGQMIKN